MTACPTCLALQASLEHALRTLEGAERAYRFGTVSRAQVIVARQHAVQARTDCAYHAERHGGAK